MSTVRRLLLTLLFALALAAPAAAQADGRVSLNATVGPSFASVGTTFSTMTGLDVKLNDRTSVVGEFGTLPRAPFAMQPKSPRQLRGRIHA